MAYAAWETYLPILPDVGTSFLKHKMIFAIDKDKQRQNSSIDKFASSMYSSASWKVAL
jgi:hypothetical protein